MFVCLSVANTYWWRRGLTASAIRTTLTVNYEFCRIFSNFSKRSSRIISVFVREMYCKQAGNRHVCQWCDVFGSGLMELLHKAALRDTLGRSLYMSEDRIGSFTPEHVSSLATHYY